MRTLRYFFCALAAGLILGSCIREDALMDPQGGSQARTVPEGMVVLDGSMNLPAPADHGLTKAFGEPDDAACKIMHLYLVVFDENDILLKIYEAEPGTQSHPGMPAMGFTAGDISEDFRTYFHVTMDASAEERYIHFIATPDVVASFQGSNEDLIDEAGFVAGLVTTGTKIAYWGRRKFGSIAETTNMTGIRMIRNFAKVEVNVASSVSNFSVQGFRVFDTPVYGTIAPFNDSTNVYETVTIGSGPDAVEELRVNYNRYAKYEEASTQQHPYAWLTGQDKYVGFMPPIVEYDDLSRYYDATGTDTVPWLASDGSDYLYECSYRPDRNPFIILKATYNGRPYYYKADFVYNDSDLGANQYYNILRNFKYTLNITGVNGPGSATVYDAYYSIALNNFEASTLSQELTNIALDNSRLYVSKTDILVTGGTTLKMYVKSRTGTDYTTIDKRAITVAVREATNGRRIVADENAVSIGSDVTFQGDTWKEVTINVTDATTLRPGEVWKQAIVFKNADELTRTVNLTLRRPSPLTVEVQDVVQGTNSDLTLSFTLPNNFTQAQFPMYFYVEQEENNLYPKALAKDAWETLTVESGPSKIPDNSGNTYYYRRILTWDEYQAAASNEDMNGLRTFYCYFKTLNDDSATTVWVIPAAENDYFYPFDDAEMEYTNKDTFLNDKKAATLTFPYYGTQVSVNASARIPATTNSDGTIVYSSSNTAVATVDQNGTVTGVAAGQATISASVAATDNYQAAGPVSYPVYVVAGNTCGLQMAWKNEPTYVVRRGGSYAIREPVAVATATTGTVAVTYTTSSVDGGAVTVNETNADANGYVTVTGTHSGTVTVTATATVTSGGNTVMTRSLSYDLLVVDDKAPAGTVYHFESFYKNSFGDYDDSAVRVVTDGVSYSSGNNVTADFYANTNRAQDIPVSRYIFYPYYNETSGVSRGLAASGYGKISASGPEQAYASHARLVSKAIDLSTARSAKMTMYHVGRYFTDALDQYDGKTALDHMKEDLSVWFSKDGGTTWEKQTIHIYPDGNSWTYVRTAFEIPAGYCTANFKLAFDYVSTGTRSEQARDADGHLLYYAVDGQGNNIHTPTTDTTAFPITVTAGHAGTWQIYNVEITSR